MASADGHVLRDARTAAGLSQAAVARAAGISRQAVGAIEAGHNRPGVDAALAIAAAVGRPVEALFAAASPDAHLVGGRTPAEGGALRAARVGDRVLYAAASETLAFAGWPQCNAVLDQGRPRLLPGGDLDALVVVGCDPALGLAAAMLLQRGPRSLIALAGSTTTARAAMRDGRAHGALVHDRVGRIPTPPPGALRIEVARWRVGIAQRGRRARSVAELCARGARVVQREAGASSQKALAAAVAAQGAPALRGPIAEGHLEVARKVAGGATAGVTMEPAALQFGLAFGALEEHVAELWIDARWRAHAGVEAVGDVLRSEAFTSRLDVVGGYDVARSGSQNGGER